MIKPIFIIALLSILVRCPSYADAPNSPESFPFEENPVAELRTSPEREVAQPARAISSEHVNLVRVAGEAIVDVVYDAQALEVEPDKAHGTVFLRVRPAWKSSGKTQTAAYFNTKDESYGLMLEVKDIPSQTVVIASKIPPPPQSASPFAPEASHLVKLTARSYIDELKECLLRAVRNEFLPVPEVAGTFSKTQRQFVPLSFAAREKSCNGFLLSERRAYVARDYTVDVISVRNLMLEKRTVPLGRMARDTAGILALASEVPDIGPGQVADVVLISRRSLRESEGLVTLAVDSICRKKPTLGDAP